MSEQTAQASGQASEDAVLTEERDGVLIVTINRPKAKNAVNGAVARGVAAAMDLLDSREDLRVGVLTGAGGTFCSAAPAARWPVRRSGPSRRMRAWAR